VKRIIFTVLVIGLVAPAGEALAWSNGRSGPNSFGTHDWIVREGVRLAGRRGRWVCLKTAMRASDDPDTKNGIDHASGTWWHVWDEWGSAYGGAPEAVAVWHRRADRKLARGRRCPASRALGLMAHMLGDVAQPMHTDQTKAEEAIHSSYERSVDSRCTAASCRYRARNDGRDSGGPYARTRRLALQAHPSYRPLVRSYRRGGYTRRVDAITRRQLNRASNILADLIRSL
jgi:hypothetical protein